MFDVEMETLDTWVFSLLITPGSASRSLVKFNMLKWLFS
jgi:hypothetical protein